MEGKDVVMECEDESGKGHPSLKKMRKEIIRIHSIRIVMRQIRQLTLD